MPCVTQEQPDKSQATRTRRCPHQSLSQSALLTSNKDHLPPCLKLSMLMIDALKPRLRSTPKPERLRPVWRMRSSEHGDCSSISIQTGKYMAILNSTNALVTCSWQVLAARNEREAKSGCKTSLSKGRRL